VLRFLRRIGMRLRKIINRIAHVDLQISTYITAAGFSKIRRLQLKNRRIAQGHHDINQKMKILL
jgi:hypothetical protein